MRPFATLLYALNNNNKNSVSIFMVISLWLRAIARIHSVHLSWAPGGGRPSNQANNNRQLPSTSTIAVCWLLVQMSRPTANVFNWRTRLRRLTVCKPCDGTLQDDCLLQVACVTREVVKSLKQRQHRNILGQYLQWKLLTLCRFPLIHVCSEGTDPMMEVPILMLKVPQWGPGAKLW